MANFDTSAAKRQSVREANNLLELIQHVYQSGKQVQTLIATYQAGTDPVLNGAINALYTSAERAELVAMLTPIAALATDWETNHRGAIGL